MPSVFDPTLIEEVPSRNLIPAGVPGVYYVEDEDQIVVRF